ncbi:MAG: response regulator transcription factor [Chloroflexus sp.]
MFKFKLNKLGLAVETANNGKEALEKIKNNDYDLVVLDVMMPEMDGIEACEQIRNIPELNHVIITFLTARNEDYSQVAGFEAGADEYITKPFKVAEFVARVEAILRRVDMQKARTAPTFVQVGDLAIDAIAHKVSVRGAEIKLTPMEFELLYFLAANAGQVFTREVLFREVWGYEYVGETNLVDVCVRRLREKVEVEPSKPKVILTVRGVGYKLERA